MTAVIWLLFGVLPSLAKGVEYADPNVKVH
jgi:hypothetical protein